MKKIILLMAVFIPLLIASCSKNEPVSAGGTYMPTKTGSYWISNSWGTDSVGNVDPTSQSSSTLTAGNSFTLNGKTATNFYNLNQDGLRDTTVLAIEEKLVFIEGSQFNNFTSILTMMSGSTMSPIDLGLTWVKIADPNASTWDVASVPINDIDISQMFSIPATLSGTMKITGSKKGTATVTIQGTNYTAQEYNLVIGYTGKVKAAGIDAADVTFGFTQKTWFVENVGQVKSEATPSMMSVKLSSLAKLLIKNFPDINQSFGGSKDEVVSFKIAP